jgi:hypothetical protein
VPARAAAKAAAQSRVAKKEEAEDNSTIFLI